jgi:hypothetical protein
MKKGNGLLKGKNSVNSALLFLRVRDNSHGKYTIGDHFADYT